MEMEMEWKWNGNGNGMEMEIVCAAAVGSSVVELRSHSVAWGRPYNQISSKKDGVLLGI